MLDQLCDRDHLQAEAPLELDQLRQPLDRAVVVDQLADHSGGRQTSEDREVHGGLGVAGALQHTPVAGTEREDVTRLDELLRPRRIVGEDPDRARPIIGADSRGNALGGVDADREIRALGLSVPGHHRPQTEAAELVLKHRDADDAAAVADHHVDGLRRCLGGGHDQVALVLPILVIGHDHELPLADVLNDILDAVER